MDSNKCLTRDDVRRSCCKILDLEACCANDRYPPPVAVISKIGKTEAWRPVADRFRTMSLIQCCSSTAAPHRFAQLNWASCLDSLLIIDSFLQGFFSISRVRFPAAKCCPFRVYFFLLVGHA